MCKTMKRLLFIIIVCIMLGSIGCESIGGMNKASEAVTNETVLLPESIQKPVVELPHVEITLGLVAETYSAESPTTPEFATQVEDMLTLLNQKAMDDGLNTTVKIKWLSSIYDLDMANQKDGVQCDAYFIRQQDSLELSQAGYILPLNDLIKKHGPSYYKFLMENPYVLKGMGIDLEYQPIYILPTNRMGTDANVVLMDKQIADKYDLNITNLDDYVEAMRTIKAGGEQKIPSSFNIFDFFDEYMGLHGYRNYPSIFSYFKLDDTGSTIYPAVEIDEYKQMLVLLQELYNDQLTGSYRDLYTSLSMGETYSIITYPSLFLTQKNTLRKNKEFKIFPLMGSNRVYSQGVGLAISANTQNPDRVMMFIDWIYSDPECMEIWLYGGGLSEGVNPYYALDDKGRITYKKPIDPMYDWLYVAGDTIFSMELARVPHYLPEGFVEIYIEILNSCIPRSEMPYPGDSLEEGTGEYEELQQLLDECDKYYDYIPALLEFRTNPNYDVNKVFKDLEDAGLKDTAQKLTDLFSK